MSTYTIFHTQNSLMTKANPISNYRSKESLSFIYSSDSLQVSWKFWCDILLKIFFMSSPKLKPKRLLLFFWKRLNVVP